ncbi:hypothetical protein GKQ77_25010 [Streptomyces sp. BG9H]|uniref:Chaplin domain-containing protein n=1 Tax=Streptomyces anatolicus TaxID=2675858 RepID=A0ABS6YTM1_9ACTN|nr:hypothetical protein [Streptomyces anatolicus]MBW5424786.1 hypothetical protein [Streptomyces anatolicus]
MKKITALTALALSTLAVTAPAPAHADDGHHTGNGTNAANNWNFTAADVCLQELAVVPVLGDWVGDGANNCANGNVIDRAVKALPPLG